MLIQKKLENHTQKVLTHSKKLILSLYMLELSIPLLEVKNLMKKEKSKLIKSEQFLLLKAMKILTVWATLFLYMMLLMKMKDLIKEFAVKEFLPLKLELKFTVLILKKLPPLLLTVVLPWMLEIKSGICVLKTLMKSKDSKKKLLNGSLKIILLLMIFLNQLLLNQFPSSLLLPYQLVKKISGHQPVMEISNPPLISIKMKFKMDPSWNLLNYNMNPLLLLNHSMDKILTLLEISELLLTLGNMDKEIIMLNLLLSNSHLNILWDLNILKENYKYHILLMMEKNLFFLYF